MKLHGYAGAPNPRRVTICAAEKGIDLEHVEVNILAGEQREEAFREKNWLRKIPVLELDDGRYLSESISICRYLEELNPEPNLFGTEAFEMAEIDMWLRRAEMAMMTPVGMVWVHSSPATAPLGRHNEEIGAMYRQATGAAYQMFDEYLEGKDFLTQDRLTIADIVHANDAGLCGQSGWCAL